MGFWSHPIKMSILWRCTIRLHFEEVIRGIDSLLWQSAMNPKWIPCITTILDTSCCTTRHCAYWYIKRLQGRHTWKATYQRTKLGFWRKGIVINIVLITVQPFTCCHGKSILKMLEDNCIFHLWNVSVTNQNRFPEKETFWRMFITFWRFCITDKQGLRVIRSMFGLKQA